MFYHVHEGYGQIKVSNFQPPSDKAPPVQDNAPGLSATPDTEITPTADAHIHTVDNAQITSSGHGQSVSRVGHWLLYLAAAFILFEVEAWLAASFQPNVSVPIWRLIVETMMMLAAVVPAFLMARVEGHSFSDFGLPLRCAFRQEFWVGSFWGLGALTAMMLLLRSSGAFQFGHLALHGVRIWKFAVYYAALFLATAFFEEFLLRGYSQWILSRAIKFWPAAISLSILFGYMHQGNPGEAKTGLVAAGLIGFFLCLTLRRTGNLWWAVGFHMAWDWGESFLYSVPDSGALLPGHLLNSTMHGSDWLTGGSVGPEGSYLVFVVIAVLWILFSRAYPEAKYLPTKSNSPSA